MEKYPIYTEINNCRDCYKCVRTCPVKAIQIRNAHAEILHDRCTYCGTCVNECPNGVKVIRNDLDKVEMAFLSHRRVIVSLAPSYMSGSPELRNIAALLKCAGFSGYAAA